MSLQTKAINVLSLAVAVSSAFCGSKYTERIVMLKSNENFIRNLNTLSYDAASRWSHDYEALTSKIDQLKKLISFMKETESQRIMINLEKEREILHQNYKCAIKEKFQEVENEMRIFQSKVNQKIELSGSLLANIEAQLNDKLMDKNEIKKLEQISQMIIEDKIEGPFNNCFSLSTLKGEFKELLPLVKHYNLINYEKISLLKYLISRAFAYSMFPVAPMQSYDILAELNDNVDKGDLRRALFLFNNLRGWPRLLLKDWAEKCRLRLEFTQEIKCKLYMNKI
jgi:hypothetical protein